MWKHCLAQAVIACKDGGYCNSRQHDAASPSKGSAIERASIPQEPPKLTSTVPFRHELDFVDRGDLLARIDERCSQPASRVALVGLGGVG